MKLSKNFNLSEFNSKDGTAADQLVIKNLTILAEQLEALRDYLGKPIQVTSGYRSKEHNAKIGGAKNSTHVNGMAADIKVKGLTPLEVYNAIEKLIADGKMKQGGLGLYRSWIHYDIYFNGKTPRRWVVK
jgi:uncharacterized protein YcbK (DUF882 family)